MPNLFGPGLDPCVLFFVWVLPDRIAALRPGHLQNWDPFG